jgi:hypothetical protein
VLSRLRDWPFARIDVPHQVSVELELPEDWRRFRLPPALHDRLQELLDRQDREGKLTSRERNEARALAELVDMLALLKARAALSAKHPPA